MKLISRAALMAAFLFLAPVTAKAVPGTCTATTDGNVGSVTWTGTNCSGDATDGCGVSSGMAPDSDDDLSVGTHAVIFNSSCTFNRLNSVGDGATILFKAGTTTTFTNTDDYGNQSWAKGGGWAIVEPGATVKMATSLNGTCGVALTGGHLVIQGRVLHETTVSGAVDHVDATHVDVHMTDAVSDAAAGDLLRFLTGPARGMTFNISNPMPIATAQNIVRIDSSTTDAIHDWSTQGCTVDVTDGRKVTQTSGTDLVSVNDGGYLGKFMKANTGGILYPVVKVDQVGSANDVFWSFYPAAASLCTTGFRMAYGFESGGDTVQIERPARMALSAGGPARFCRYSCDDTSKCSVAHAVFDGVGVQSQGVDNKNRPSEFFDVDHASFRVNESIDAAPIALSPGASVSDNITLSFIEVFNSRAILDLSGSGHRLENSVCRDFTAVASSCFKIQSPTVPTVPIVVEDSNSLRVASMYAGSGQGTDSRFPVTFRRVWGVGIGRRSTSDMGIAWIGPTLDPRTLTPDDKNSGKFYVLDSLLMSYGNSALATDGRSVGQRTYAVNTIGAYSGNSNQAFSGGIGSGSAYNSLLTRNPDVGAKATTSLIGSVISLNGPAGIAGDSRRCSIAICAPTPGTRRILGNLSYGNTGPAMRMLEHTADTDAERNTLVDSTSGSPVVSFAPINPDESSGDATCTGNGSLECGPSGTGRPSWFSAFPVPSGGPKTTLKDNLIGNAPASQSVINKGGSYFTNDDLLSTYNYYWRGSGNGDKGTLDGAGTGELLNQADPFVSASGHDYRPTTITAGSTGTNRMGASWAGPVVDPATLPAVYKMLIDAGVKYDQRSGDIEPVNPELGTAADFLPGFTMIGKRVSFIFPSTPTMPSNACANPTDKSEKCGTLLLRLYRTDGIVVPPVDKPPKSVRVPVQGSSKIYSVSESAIALSFVGMADPGQLDIALKIGSTESPHDVWSMASFYKIPRYVVPVGGALAGSGTPPIGGPR